MTLKQVSNVCSAEALVSIPMKAEIPLNYMIVEVRSSTLKTSLCLFHCVFFLSFSKQICNISDHNVW